MKTAQERIQAFKADLTELLAKHGAEMSAETDDWAMYNNPHIFVELESVWDDGDCKEEYAQIELRGFINATNIATK